MTWLDVVAPADGAFARARDDSLDLDARFADVTEPHSRIAIQATREEPLQTQRRRRGQRGHAQVAREHSRSVSDTSSAANRRRPVSIS
jgi:hypothetical protein